MVLLPLSVMNDKFLIIMFILFSIFLSACDEEDTLSSIQLSDYIQNSGLTLVKDDLIACAASGKTSFLGDQEKQISIFFYPEGGAHTFKYFETTSEDIDPNDYAIYTEKLLVDEPIFNDYLRKFQKEESKTPIWCIVTFIKNKALHISNPIGLKLPSLPTEYNSSLLEVDLSVELSPKFLWEDGLIDENEIYFHVISDDSGNLISGTYTFENQFQFYNLDNVVLNIRDVIPIPTLESDRTYTMTIMGVSIDNWVNIIMEKDFTPN